MADYYGQTVDVVEDFEDALASPWSEALDGSNILNPRDSAAKYNGTYGMSIATGSAAEAWVEYAFATASAGFTAGFWYKTGTYAGWSDLRWLCRITESEVGNLLRIWEGNNAGSNVREFGWSLDADVLTVSNATWYWIALNFVQGGTSTCAVYTEAHSLVGTLSSAATPDTAADFLDVGSYAVATSTACYIDDVVIDLDRSTNPILGWAAGGGASIGGALNVHVRKAL